MKQFNWIAFSGEYQCMYSDSLPMLAKRHRSSGLYLSQVCGSDCMYSRRRAVISHVGSREKQATIDLWTDDLVND